MLKSREILKKLMKQYNLNELMLSKATNYNYEDICNWCSGSRNISLDTLQEILDLFGYELALDLTQKLDMSKPNNLYMQKTYQELDAMTYDEFVDYIFVSQDKETLARICDVSVDVFRYMAMAGQKEFISCALESKSRLSVYFKINKMYDGVENEMSWFIQDVNNDLNRSEIITDEAKKAVKYLVLDIHPYDEDSEWYPYKKYIVYGVQLLDENKCDLNVGSYAADMPNEEPLSYYFEDKIGDYLLSNIKQDSIDEGTLVMIPLSF